MVAAERSPLAASASTGFRDRERFVPHTNLQNRHGYAGQLHGVVSWLMVIKASTLVILPML